MKKIALDDHINNLSDIYDQAAVSLQAIKQVNALETESAQSVLMLAISNLWEQIELLKEMNKAGEAVA